MHCSRSKGGGTANCRSRADPAMSGSNEFEIELLTCGDPRHHADVAELRERGLAVPHHYSSWSMHGLAPGSLWCRVTRPDGTLLSGFAIELWPSRGLPGTRIGRVDRLGRGLHETAGPLLGEILQAAA